MLADRKTGRSNIIPIAIGNLGIRIQFARDDFATWARDRYSKFSAPVDVVDDWLMLTIDALESDGVSGHHTLQLNQADIEFDMSLIQGQINLVSGKGWLKVSPASFDVLLEHSLRYCLILLAYRAGGMMLHGAGIVHSNAGYVFFGPSGIGKTTISRLSVEDLVLNDDLVLLMKLAGVWKVFSTPFSHPGQVQPTNGSAPVAAMVRLVQDNTVYVENLTKGVAIAETLACIPILTCRTDFIDALIVRCEDLIEQTPVYRLHFLPDQSFKDYIYLHDS
jgi:hypothetical protein